jgi:fructose-bisphosphate aldolase class II
MPLVNTREMLRKATDEKYAVCAFNVECFELAIAVIEAAEEEKAPVILSVVEPAMRAMGSNRFARFARGLAEQASVPVALHLDHGSSMKIVRECLDLGFTSVMIDASSEPLEENIKITLEAMRLAEGYGACVEGEVGYVPGVEDKACDQVGDAAYTSPDEAKVYCEKTGVHSLAISIGTVHYMVKEPLKLDFELLDEIRKTVKVPLVLHGGAAVLDKDMLTAVERGIAKYNIAYKPYRAFLHGLEDALDNLSEEVAPGKLFVSPAAVMESGVRAAKDEMASKIRLLRSLSLEAGVDRE